LSLIGKSITGLQFSGRRRRHTRGQSASRRGKQHRKQHAPSLHSSTSLDPTSRETEKRPGKAVAGEKEQEARKSIDIKTNWNERLPDAGALEEESLERAAVRRGEKELRPAVLQKRKTRDLRNVGGEIPSSKKLSSLQRVAMTVSNKPNGVNQRENWQEGNNLGERKTMRHVENRFFLALTANISTENSGGNTLTKKER